MNMKLSCAGKVFIVGEYACIDGGPAIVETVGPSFELSIEKRNSDSALEHPFAAQSPAGLFLAEHADAFRGVRLGWNDPYTTPIGVGSSSAQFILSVAAAAQLQDKPLPKASDVLQLYWNMVGNTQGLRPSGVDVVAQWMGGPLVVKNAPFSTRKLKPWRAPAELILAFTGSKAKTHEHLKKLRDGGFPRAFDSTLSRLNALTLDAVDAWEAGAPSVLGKTMNAYQRALFEGGLATKEFTDQIEELQRWPGVLGCKGTGAQGGDCVLFLIDTQVKTQISNKIQALGWQPISPDWSHPGLIKSD